MNFFKKFLVTGLGTGYLRPAPGTWGSLAAAGAFLLCVYLFGTGTGAIISAIAIAILSTVICIALGDFTEKAFGRKDPSYCTIDEWAGQAVAFIAIPLGATGDWQTTLIAIAVAFFAFRVFDITKPPPARQAEKLKAGLGVVADDLVAGVFANVATQLIMKFCF